MSLTLGTGGETTPVHTATGLGEPVVRASAHEYKRNEFIDDLSTTQSEKITFEKDTMDQMVTFMTNHTKRLYNLQTNDRESRTPALTRTGLQILADPERQNDKAILDQLVVDNQVDDQAVREYLATDKGMVSALQMLEESIAIETFGLALAGVIQHPERVYRDRHLHVDIDRGTLNKFAHKNMQTLRNAGILTNIAAGSALGGFFAGGPIGAAVGGALGLTTDAVIVFANKLKSGTTIDLNTCAQALQALQSPNPALQHQADYLRAAYGIDPNDFNVNAFGQIGLTNPNNVHTRGREQLEEGLMQKMYTRFKIMKTFGVPSGDIRIIPDMAYLGGDMRNQEQVPLVYREDERQEYERLVAAGAPTATPGDRLLLSFQARRNIATRHIQDRIGEIREKEREAGRDTTVNNISTKLNGIRTGIDRTKTALEKVNEGENGQNGLQPEIATLDNYRTALDKLDAARQTIRDAGFADQNALEAEIRRRGTVDRPRMETLRNELATAEQEVLRTQDQAEQIYRLFDNNLANLNDILGYDATLVGRVLTGLDGDALRRLPFDTIMNRINSAYEQSLIPPPIVPSLGWPRENNNNYFQRQYVLTSVAEARAGLPALVPGADLTVWRGLIDESRFIFRSIDELINEVNGAGYAPPLNPALAGDRTRVQTVIDEARMRFERRTQALRGVIAEDPIITEQHNAEATRQRDNLTARIRKLETERDQMRQEEANVENMRNPQQIVERLLEQRLNVITSNYSTIEDFHNRLFAGRGINTLDPNTLLPQDIDSIMAVINAAHAAGLTPPPPPIVNVGWPAAENNNRDRIREVISAQAEWQAKQNEPFIDHPSGDFTTWTTGLFNFNENQLRTAASPNELRARLNARGAGIPNTQAGLNQVDRVIQEARSRYEARRRYLVDRLNAARARGAVIGNPSLQDADLAFLELDNGYQQATNTLATHRVRLGGIANSTTIQTQIDNMQNEINNIHVPYTDITARLQQITTLLDSFQTPLNNLISKRNEIQGTLRVTTVAEINNLIAQRDRITDDQLNTLRTSLQTEERNLAGTTDTVRNAERAIREMPTQFDTITGIAGILALPPPPLVGGPRLIPGLTENDLLTQNFEELMRRMNQAYAESQRNPPIAPPLGWPENINNRPDIRMRVEHAIAEARARQISAFIAAPSADLTAWTAGAFGLSENIFRANTREQVIDILNQRAPGTINPALPGDLLRVDTVINHARARYEARLQALRDLYADNKIRIDELTQGESATEYRNNPRVRELMTLSDLLTRRTNIYSMSDNIIARVAEFADNRTLPALGSPEGVRYSAAERALGSRRGYYEFIDLFFDHRKNPNRDEYFNRIREILPPSLLARLLNTSLGLGLGPPPPTINAVLTNIAGLGGNLGKRRLYNATRAIMNYFTERTDSLTNP